MQPWLGDLMTAESLTEEQQDALFRCHRFTVYTLYDARLAAARYLAAHADLLGQAAAPHLERAAEIYKEIGTSVQQLRVSIEAFVESVRGKASVDARPWTQEVRASEIETLARAHELDLAGMTEIEQALAKAS